MTRFAIISDRTPSRCNVDSVVESDDNALDVAREHNVRLDRVMAVADGVEISVGDRAWHRDETITGA